MNRVQLIYAKLNSIRSETCHKTKLSYTFTSLPINKFDSLDSKDQKLFFLSLRDIFAYFCVFLDQHQHLMRAAFSAKFIIKPLNNISFFMYLKHKIILYFHVIVPDSYNTQSLYYLL